MDGLNVPFRIKIYVLPDGFVRASLETKSGNPTPIEGLALYSKIEPDILRFKEAVRKTISAHVERPKGNK